MGGKIVEVYPVIFKQFYDNYCFKRIDGKKIEYRQGKRRQVEKLFSKAGISKKSLSPHSCSCSFRSSSSAVTPPSPSSF